MMKTNARLRVIVADDDADTRELVTMALRSDASEIQTATNGAELVQQTRDCGPFDLIITDVQMPIMEGLEAVVAIRALGIDTPVLVITGHASDASTRAILVPDVTLLRKPFQVSELRRVVARLITSNQDDEPT
jgi:CheY-like chemotaxis protein